MLILRVILLIAFLVCWIFSFNNYHQYDDYLLLGFFTPIFAILIRSHHSFLPFGITTIGIVNVALTVLTVMLVIAIVVIIFHFLKMTEEMKKFSLWTSGILMLIFVAQRVFCPIPIYQELNFNLDKKESERLHANTGTPIDSKIVPDPKTATS